MTFADLVARIDHLEESCASANNEFDYLTFKTEQIPPSDFRDILSVELMWMRDELAQLAHDLRTLPVEELRLVRAPEPRSGEERTQ